MSCAGAWGRYEDVRLSPDGGDGHLGQVGYVRPPARWAVVCAFAVPITMLPSALWRLPVAFGFDMGMVDPLAPPWVWWVLPYTVLLLLLIEGLAFLTVGLVRPWGARPPRCVPFVGGRIMRPRIVAACAGIGALLLSVLWGSQAVVDLTGQGVEFSSLGWQLLASAVFVPHVTWGPLLLAVTIDYWCRHHPRAPGTSANNWQERGL